MGFSRAPLAFLALFLTTFVHLSPLRAQSSDRLWGRVTTVGGEVHEGFIRWDWNEGSWTDQLDGSKEFSPFKFQDWWNLAHPDDRHRDRVIELEGYRITWDDDEPEFPDTHESGIRFGHIRRLTVAGDDMATLELRSGRFVDLEAGSTDIGQDLREIRIAKSDGSSTTLEWEELEEVEFSAAPPGVQAPGRRLHGTVETGEGMRFTGYIAWDLRKILTTDTLVGYDSEDDRHEILFGQLVSVRPARREAEVTLSGGERLELAGGDDVDDDNDGIQISDPGLGQVEVDWDEVEVARFHSPEAPVDLGGFDGGRRLRGTVMTADSTELSGWIRWDGDEQYSWELLDGSHAGVSYDIEFGKISSIEKYYEMTTEVAVRASGVNVQTKPEDGVRVTLWDGRVFELTGSNDVDDSNNGIYVVLDGSGQSPDDEESEWVMVKWSDFRSVRFEGGEGR